MSVEEIVKRSVLLSALLVVAAACSSGSPTATTEAFPVQGYVHAGPVCPVVQDPPDPACADRPVAGAELWIVDASGDMVSVATTDADGTFTILVSPGLYTLVPQTVDGLLGTAGEQSFTVGAGSVSLDVAYDTGIR